MKNNAVIFLVFFIFISLNVIRQIGKEETVLKQPQPLQKIVVETKNISILAWNSYWHWPDFGFGKGNEGFKRHKCPLINCYLSLDRQKLHKSDAILIHGHGMQEREANELRKAVKSVQNSTQIVYFNKESSQ